MTTWLPGASEVFTQGFGVRPSACALRATRPAATSTYGLDVLVQEVIAAITTSPCADLVVLAGHRRLGADIAGGNAEALGQLGLEGAGGVLQQHAILRALRTGQRGLHGGKVEFQRVGEDRIVVGPPQALRLGIGLDQLDAVLVTAGEVQITERYIIDREEAAGGAIFRRHVGDRGAVGQRQLVEPVP